MTLPSGITGLTNWWRSEDIPGSNGAAIASWPAVASVGGGVALAQATGGFQPLVATASIGGLTAALFDGSDDKLTATIGSLTSPFTIGVVYKKVALGSATKGLLSLTNFDMLAQYSSPLLAKGIYNNGVGFMSAVPETTSAEIFIATSNGATSRIDEGGASLAGTTGTAGTTATGTALKVGDTIFGGVPIDAYIAEIAIFNIDIGTDRAVLHAGWASKFGIAVPGVVPVASAGYLRRRAA